MPSARILIQNACYHLITRGNQRQKVFRDNSDYLNYLKRLKKYKKKWGFQLYGYCLMPNHVHLLGEPKQTRNLSKFMHSLNRSYTAYFNKKYKKVGHLWQNRFQSKVIIKDQYLIDCIQYIEFNPVRANITSLPSEYPWSSYKERVLNSNGKCLLDNLYI